MPTDEQGSIRVWLHVELILAEISKWKIEVWNTHVGNPSIDETKPDISYTNVGIQLSVF